MATSMPSKFLKVFTVEEKSFPRISYFMPRVRSVLTRTENILNFEFNNPERGIKRMRSDKVELEALKTLGKKELNVVAMSSDEKLLADLAEKDLIMNRQICTKPTESSNACSSSILQESVVVVITREQNLETCLKLLAAPDWLGILVICSDTQETNMRCLENVVKENLRKFDTERCLVIINPTERQNISTVSNFDVYCSSKQTFSSKNVSLSPSTSHLASLHESCTRDPSPVRLLRTRAADDSVAMVTPPTSPKQRHASLSHNPPGSVPRSNSSSPLKTRPSSPSSPVSESKRTKLSFDKLTQPVHSKNTNSPESMDVDAGEEQMVYPGKQSHSMVPAIERTPNRCEGFDFDNEQLKKAVSFRFETMTVDIISRILKLLRSVRDRKDKNAKTASITTLDKIIYEVEGLLSQSITDIGLRMKQEIEEQELSRSLAEDLLSVNGVYGCGTLFDRLCIHIEAEEEGQKDKIKEDIDTVTRKHQYTKGFSIQVVKSKPEAFRRGLVGLA